MNISISLSNFIFFGITHNGFAKRCADLQSPKTSKPTAIAKTLFCDLKLVQKIVETKLWRI